MYNVVESYIALILLPLDRFCGLHFRYIALTVARGTRLPSHIGRKHPLGKNITSSDMSVIASTVMSDTETGVNNSVADYHQHSPPVNHYGSMHDPRDSAAPRSGHATHNRPGDSGGESASSAGALSLPAAYVRLLAVLVWWVLVGCLLGFCVTYDSFQARYIYSGAGDASSNKMQFPSGDVIGPLWEATVLPREVPLGVPADAGAVLWRRSFSFYNMTNADDVRSGVAVPDFDVVGPFWFFEVSQRSDGESPQTPPAPSCAAESDRFQFGYQTWLWLDLATTRALWTAAHTAPPATEAEALDGLLVTTANLALLTGLHQLDRMVPAGYDRATICNDLASEIDRTVFITRTVRELLLTGMDGSNANRSDAVTMMIAKRLFDPIGPLRPFAIPIATPYVFNGSVVAPSRPVLQSAEGGGSDDDVLGQLCPWPTMQNDTHRRCNTSATVFSKGSQVGSKETSQALRGNAPSSCANATTLSNLNPRVAKEVDLLRELYKRGSCGNGESSEGNSAAHAGWYEAVSWLVPSNASSSAWQPCPKDRVGRLPLEFLDYNTGSVQKAGELRAWAGANSSWWWDTFSQQATSPAGTNSTPSELAVIAAATIGNVSRCTMFRGTLDAAVLVGPSMLLSSPWDVHQSSSAKIRATVFDSTILRPVILSGKLQKSSVTEQSSSTVSTTLEAHLLKFDDDDELHGCFDGEGPPMDRKGTVVVNLTGPLAAPLYVTPPYLVSDVRPVDNHLLEWTFAEFEARSGVSYSSPTNLLLNFTVGANSAADESTLRQSINENIRLMGASVYNNANFTQSVLGTEALTGVAVSAVLQWQWHTTLRSPLLVRGDGAPPCLVHWRQGSTEQSWGTLFPLYISRRQLNTTSVLSRSPLIRGFVLSGKGQIVGIAVLVGVVIIPAVAVVLAGLRNRKPPRTVRSPSGALLRRQRWGAGGPRSDDGRGKPANEVDDAAGEGVVGRYDDESSCLTEEAPAHAAAAEGDEDDE